MTLMENSPNLRLETPYGIVIILVDSAVLIKNGDCCGMDRLPLFPKLGRRIIRLNTSNENLLC